MEIQKELNQISLQISEPEYRQRPELSYSTLSTYEKTGFNGLEHLFDKKESPSLLLGSVVDTILTGGEDEFQSLYTVLDINVTDSGIDICKALLNLSLPFKTFEEIPEDIVSQTAKSVGFWQADKWDKKRYAEVLKTGNIADYYNVQYANDKTVISSELFNTAVAMVNALRESPATCGYFADNDELSPVRRYYQLKFAARFEGVGYRCMADLIIVDYEKKSIYLTDLKTSSKPEWDFYKSFIEWNYACQARLYYRIIAANSARDEYFKDFKIHDYRFIVVNKSTLQPLVWIFKDTKKSGELVYGKNNQIVIRDPFTIGTELQGYLNLKPLVPNGINTIGDNDIIKHLKEL